MSEEAVYPSLRNATVHLVADITHFNSGVFQSTAYRGTLPDGWQIRVRDDGRAPGRGSCGLGHSVGYTSTAVFKKTGLHALDCPCDIACPKCEAGAGQECQTATGWPSKWHVQRISFSGRCQSLLDGTRTPCDLGDHDWKPRRDVKFAKCARCEREEPIQAQGLTYGQKYLNHPRD